MKRVEVLLQYRYKQDVRQIALVPLHHQWELAGALAHSAQLLAQLVEALDVFLELVRLRVGYEDHAVRAFEHGDACLLIEHLAGDRIELKADGEPVNASKLQRQQVKVECALGLGINRDHLADIRRVDGPVNEMQVRGFAAQADAVVNNLTVDLAFRHVDERHIDSCPTSRFNHRLRRRLAIRATTSHTANTVPCVPASVSWA